MTTSQPAEDFTITLAPWAMLNPPPTGPVAECGACGEQFTPAGPEDLTHPECEDGLRCGGLGKIIAKET